MEHPHGMLVGVQTHDILDIDEADFMVESSNRKIGKVMREFRRDESGPFNRNTKLNLLLCVGADEDDCDCVTFHDTWVGEGTTLWKFYSFMQHLITYISIHHARSQEVVLFHDGQLECPQKSNDRRFDF